VIPDEIEVRKWAETNGHAIDDYKTFIESKLFKDEIES